MATENIIVTGFGPFGCYQVNASWETVKLLPEVIQGYNVIKEEIPVCYDTVDTRIKELWQNHEPKLVVHVGVSHLADKITIETCAYKNGYGKVDIDGKCPSQGVCEAECGEDKINTGLDIDEIFKQLDSDLVDKVCCSQDAGRYLCEYIYFTSLSLDKNITMFIHVPILDSPLSGRHMAEIIEQVITLALKQSVNNSYKKERKAIQ